MTPLNLQNLKHAAEWVSEAADFIQENYPIYVDSSGNEHYVDGPALKELEGEAISLQCQITHLLSETAKKLPSLS